MPKVLHVITGLGAGGAERSLYNLVTTPLDGIAHQVISLAGMGEYGQKLLDAGIPVQVLGMTGLRGAPWALVRLRRAVRQACPDVVQGWMYHGNLAASLARGPGRPVAWNIRQSMPDIMEEKRGTRAVIRLCRRLSGQADRILYNSSLARQHHEGLGFAAQRADVVPNGFDTEKWRPDPANRAAIRAELGIPNDAPLLGYVGRGHKVKDIPTLLRALKGVMADHPDLHVVTAGEGTGPEAPDLAPLYAALPLDRLRPLGHRSDVPKLMAAFDLFCLCSRAEAFPNVLGRSHGNGGTLCCDGCGRLRKGAGRYGAAGFAGRSGRIGASAGRPLCGFLPMTAPPLAPPPDAASRTSLQFSRP